MKTIKKIMELLESGIMVRVNDCDMWLSPDKHYICWRHFGTSANSKSIKDLYWILCNMANDGDMKSPVYENVDRSLYGLNPTLRRVKMKLEV